LLLPFARDAAALDVALADPEGLAPARGPPGVFRGPVRAPLLPAPAHAPALLEAGDGMRVIHTVTALLFEAARDRASDIHLEPYERTLAVRFRIDGILHDVLAPPARLAPPLASRPKAIGG